MTPKAIHEFSQRYTHEYSRTGDIPISELRDLCYTALHAVSDAQEIIKEAQAAAVAEAVAKETDRCCGILAGGDKPWREHVAAIREKP